MIFVIDASVAMKWFLRFRPDEADVPQALALLDQAACGLIQVAQPPHFYAEMGAVLARTNPDMAQANLRDLWELDLGITDTPEIYATALTLAARMRHHLFDTLYHAVALHTPGAVLITADRRYFAKAFPEGHIRLLSEWILAE